jgi:hypothetical protein
MIRGKLAKSDPTSSFHTLVNVDVLVIIVVANCVRLEVDVDDEAVSGEG